MIHSVWGGPAPVWKVCILQPRSWVRNFDVPYIIYSKFSKSRACNLHQNKPWKNKQGNKVNSFHFLLSYNQQIFQSPLQPALQNLCFIKTQLHVTVVDLHGYVIKFSSFKTQCHDHMNPVLLNCDYTNHLIPSNW